MQTIDAGGLALAIGVPMGGTGWAGGFGTAGQSPSGILFRHRRDDLFLGSKKARAPGQGLPVSNVALVVDEAKGKTAKVAYKMKENKKIRSNRSNGKEI